MTRVDQKALESMDIKKGQSQTLNVPNKKRALEFFASVKGELQRIEWTSKEELKAYTKIVLASMFTFGFCIYVIDLLVKGCLDGVGLIVKLLIG